MTDRLLTILRCPLCKSAKGLQLKVFGRNVREIVSGQVACSECQKQWSIRNGILDLLNRDDELCRTPDYGNLTMLNRTQIEEIVRKWEEKHNLTDDWIYQLPYSRFDENRGYIESWVGKDCNSYYLTHFNFYDILGELNLVGGETVLDLGAGSCWTSREFARKGCQCVACDIIEIKYLGLMSSQIYMEREDIYYERILLPFGELPFVDSSFDVVTSTGALQYVNDLPLVFREVARVLKPEGRLAIITGGVHGFIKRGTGLGHSLRKYIDAATSAGLKLELYVPLALKKLLEEGLAGQGWVNRLSRVVAFFWRLLPSFKLRLLDVLLYPMIKLLGLHINGIATKIDA